MECGYHLHVYGAETVPMDDTRSQDRCQFPRVRGRTSRSFGEACAAEAFANEESDCTRFGKRWFSQDRPPTDTYPRWHCSPRVV